MNDKKTTDFLKYIDENIKNGEDVSNEKLAKLLGYEQHYLTKKFRDYLGDTIQEYVKKRKMLLASYDLLKTKEKIIDIAQKYGYSTDGFTKAFKSVYGETPIKYIKNGYINKDYKEIMKDDFGIVPFEIESCQIKNQKELMFIGLSAESLELNNTEFDIKCSYLKDYFEILSMLRKNDNYYQISYNSKEKREYMLANYYNPLEDFPSDFEIKVIPKQKWLILDSHGPNFIQTTYYLKRYIFEIWFPKHKEYELDDNYEIAFEKNHYNYDNLSDFEKNISWVEVWIPIRKKKRI